VGRFPLAGLVRIAIMIPDAIRDSLKIPARAKRGRVEADAKASQMIC